MSIFELSGIFGSIFSGVLTDYVYTRQILANSNHNKINPAKNEPVPESIRIRMSVSLIYLIIAIASLHILSFYVTSDSTRLFLFLISFVLGFVCYGSNSLLGVCAMEFAPKKYSGSSHAIAALAANLGAVFAGVPFGFLSKIYSWKGAFFVVEMSSLVIFIFSLISRKRMCKFETFSKKRKTQ